jgi:glycosyltransferase involved in cell wall biosynthesis
MAPPVSSKIGDGKKPAKGFDIDVIIPARDEEATIADVVRGVPRMARSVVVVDNGSTDATARRAQAAGAVVIHETRQGYGAACLRGISHLASLPRPPDVVVFLSADGSHVPAEIPHLCEPLRENLFDLVIGSRVLGHGKLAARQVAGNKVATTLIHAIYGHRYTDVSSYRAIRFPALIALGLSDGGHGFLVEMQVRALKTGLRIAETPVAYHPPDGARRGGFGSGGVGQSARALFQIFRHSTTR